ncbi:hypothetical protein ACJJTC_015700 [Scirpophaga incertulas]
MKTEETKALKQTQTYEPYSDENFVLEQNLPNAPSPEISNAPVESSDIFPDTELETVGDTGDEVRSQPQTEDLPSEPHYPTRGRRPPVRLTDYVNLSKTDGEPEVYHYGEV